MDTRICKLGARENCLFFDVFFKSRFSSPSTPVFAVISIVEQKTLKEFLHSIVSSMALFRANRWMLQIVSSTSLIRLFVHCAEEEKSLA